MQRHSILYGALMAAFGLLPTGQAAAADWGGSYAVGDSCHCTGAMDPGLARQQQPTPVGGQTIARICERLGPGPGLTLINGRFDHVVYPDAQCGNGPFAEGTELLDADCAGTLEPGSGDCQPVGPRWDLAAAYQDADDDSRVVASTLPLDGADPMTPTDGAEPVDASRLAAVDSIDTTDTVEIGGERWRAAPPGTPVSGGVAGSRIILDGEVWLKADDPVFAAQRELEAHRATVAARNAGSEPQPRIAAARPIPVEESPEALRERQRELVARARQRAAERRAAGIEQDPVVVVEVVDAPEPVAAAPEPAAPEPITPEPAPVASAPEQGDDAPLVPAVADEELADAVSDRGDDDALAADTVVEQSGGATDEQAVPVSALRLPVDARSSASDFGYVQAMPISYDIGGAGVMLEGSAEMRNRYHVLARAGIANKYQEILLGAGLHYTPPSADRLTLLVTAGMEHSVFPLESAQTGIEVDDASTGFFVSAGTRLVLNRSFELEGGVGYSSFHEGDPHAFGGGYFHINDSVDLMSRFEVGDQDSYGIGVRVYY